METPSTMKIRNCKRLENRGVVARTLSSSPFNRTVPRFTVAYVHWAEPVIFAIVVALVHWTVAGAPSKVRPESGRLIFITLFTCGAFVGCRFLIDWVFSQKWKALAKSGFMSKVFWIGLEPFVSAAAVLWASLIVVVIWVGRAANIGESMLPFFSIACAAAGIVAGLRYGSLAIDEFRSRVKSIRSVRHRNLCMPHVNKTVMREIEFTEAAMENRVI